MTAISRDHGDYPIFDVSTQSVAQTMGLAPSLSNWSVHLEIPLEVFQVDCT